VHPVRLRTEYLREPLGLGITRPRFSWTCEGGVRQSAYRVIAEREEPAGGRTPVWDSGRVASSRMTHVAYEGTALAAGDRVVWTVQLWDEHDQPGDPSASWFELGLLDASDWRGDWITAGTGPRAKRLPGRVAPRRPVDCFRRRFTARGTVVRARLYATAAGVYSARLNGRPVGEWCLAPGSTDYRHRVQYQTYDVTDLVGTQNTLEVSLADGWYRGSVGCFGPTNVFGRETMLLAQLELTYADGSRETISTDGSWEWSDDGPVRFADLKDGEVVDFRLTPTFSGRARPVGASTHGMPVPTATDNVAPTRHEVFGATLLTTPSGARVLDFGQNIAGFVGFDVTGRPGQRLRLRLGEILDADGEFTQQNIQARKPVGEFGKLSEMLLMLDQADRIPGDLQPTPLQEVVVTCSGGRDRYETEFAVFGFRYALLETDVAVAAEDFRAVAVYSDMEETGTFTCSDPDVDQFVANTRWSMKGNFLDVPTDCPTRERMGWTGDAQVFFETGAYLADVAAFIRKYLRDLADAQHKDGWVPAVVPYSGVAMMYDNSGKSVGWADALVLLPYRFWKRYGDRRIIEDFYPMMRRYGDFMIAHTGHKSRRAARANPFNAYVYEKGFHLGEWLEPEEFRDDVRNLRLLRTEEATAYLHYTMRHLAEIARELGQAAEAARWSEYAEGAARAYAHLFVADGTIDTDRQAKLVRPLALGLLDGEARRRVQERLVRAVENRGHRIGTGFLSTPFVLPALTEAGRADVAYRMLENTEAPSWLAEVKAGATTVWEDWEGKASHNHYSPGAVCQWLFDTVAGLRVTGENHFLIAPVPGGTLTYAAATYASPYGPVAGSWERTASGWTFTVTVPPNTTADVVLPDGVRHAVEAGTHTFATEENHD